MCKSENGFTFFFNLKTPAIGIFPYGMIFSLWRFAPELTMWLLKTFPIYFFPVLPSTDKQGLSCPWNFEGIFYKKYMVLVDVNEI